MREVPVFLSYELSCTKYSGGQGGGKKSKIKFVPLPQPQFSGVRPCRAVGPDRKQVNTNHVRKASALAVWEQLHSSLMGVNVKADSTFSRGMGLRECCAPARWGRGCRQRRKVARQEAVRPDQGKTTKEEAEALHS